MEIYILPNGEEVDLTNYPEQQKIIFLSENPGAKLKKVEGVAAGANAMPSNNMFAPSQDGELVLENTSSVSPGSLDINNFEYFNPNVDENLKSEIGESINRFDKDSLLKQNQFGLFEDENIQLAIDNSFINDQDLIDAGYKDDPSGLSTINPIPKYKRDKARSRIATFQSKGKDEIQTYIDIQKLNQPYIYEEFDPQDNFVNEVYGDVYLDNMNQVDFAGFMKNKGYDEDLKRFLELEMDKKSYSNAYDPELAYERRKLKYFNLYLNEQIQRDIKQQKLMFQSETGIDPNSLNKKFQISPENIKLNQYESYVRKEFPVISAKMQEADERDNIEYQKLLKSNGNIGAGQFLLNITGSGWNGISDRIEELSASFYGILPGDYFEGVSESIREELALEKLGMEGNWKHYTGPGRFVTGLGNSIVDTETNTTYLVTKDGRILDKTRSLDATNFLTQEKADKIRKEARERGIKDKAFSVLGAFDSGANVIGDLFVQIAMTRGMGNGIRAVGGFTNGMGILGKTRSFLKSIPIKRSMADAIIAQGTMGFSRGYEQTLAQARQMGINDQDASELAAVASIQTGILYALTAPISPQTKATDAIFGKLTTKNFVGNALKEYTKKGKSSFIDYFRSGKLGTIVNLGGEGLKEVFQENVQQIGEVFAVNKNINEIAGKKILKDTMSMQDFLDTTILSFFAGAIMPGAGVTLNLAKQTARQMLGMSAVDRFNNLSYLAYKKEDVKNLLAKQVNQGIYTQQEADQVLEEINAFNNNINRMPQDLSAEAASQILGDVNEVGRLRQQRKTEDPSFHSETDARIAALDEKIKTAYYNDITKRKSGIIEKAIKKGKFKNISWNEFESTENLVDFLVEELGYTKAKATSTAQKYGTTIQRGDQQYIVINNEKASKDGKVTVKEHEFLHGVMYETIRNNPEAQMLLGKSLLAEVMKIQDKLDSNDSLEKALPDEFLKDFTSYITFYNDMIKGFDADLKSGVITKQEYDRKVSEAVGNQWEEVLTLYSDAITVGAVTYEADTFTKIADTIRQVLQFLGFKNIKFNSARDVYNFIKDYNSSINSRILTADKNKALIEVAEKGAQIDTEALKKESQEFVDKNKKEAPQQPVVDREPTLDEIQDIEDNFNFDEKFALKPKKRTSSEEFKSKVNSFYNKNIWGKSSGVDNVLYDILNEYEKPILDKASVLYGNLPDYSVEDMLAETSIALIPHIRNFNKEFLELREKKREELKQKGFSSSEINTTLNKLDEKGYKNSKGKTILENNNLNGWINSQLRNKMKQALKTGNVTSQKFTDEIDERATSIETSNETIIQEQKEEFEKNQDELITLLKDPTFGFSNSDGDPILIEGVPVGGDFALNADDPSIAVNKKLKSVTDPAIKKQLEQEKRDLKRGLELEAKERLTDEEVKELKELKSFKTYSVASGGFIKTYKAYSQEINPAAIIAAEVRREILSAPNIETLDFRNFKEKLAILSQTLSRRMTFKNSTDLDSFMFNNWKTIWEVINNPIDPVTGESTYAIKKVPPRLKITDDQGRPQKTKDINVVTFLQSYFGVDEATRIIRTYSKNPNVLLKKLLPVELGRTGNKLWATAYFDRRTALMELFGDVLVLQEARNSLRNDAFLNEISKRNVNLYNDLQNINTRNKIISNFAKGKSDKVKFSMSNGTRNNAKLNSYLTYSNDPNQQFFTAKIMDQASRQVSKFSQKRNKFKVPDLGKMNDKAVSYYLIDKISQGYNEFDFKNANNKKGKITKGVLDITKFSLENNKNYSNNLNTAFNQIIEENTGVSVDETFSKARAEQMAKNISKKIYLPPADSDFLGLMYMVASGKGKKGQQQIDWITENIIKPYSEGSLDLINARNSAHRDWKNLFDKQTKKLLREDSSYSGFSNDQAIRVYLWKKAGYQIPDLESKDIFNLSEVVRTNPKLKKLAQQISLLAKQPNGYIEPPQQWVDGTILSDVQSILTKLNRSKYLQRWKQNVDLIFNKETKAKLEAVYGTPYVDALTDILNRMETGTNKPKGLDKATRGWVDWLNGSVGVTMFFNMRSALLQTISATNFINMTFNNPLAAGKAILNVPQMAKDFKTLWNSPYLKDRRSGLLSDLQESEIVDVLNNPNNKTWAQKTKALIFWGLKKGFIPTRAADSLAITLGGTTFYRNRINDLVKKGVDKAEAEKQAMLEFYETAEISQQSADPSKISQNQASIKGRLFLSFQNTPLQYARIIKRSALNIAKNRGNFAGNVSKIVYYAAIQNFIFNFLQNALFRMWDDDDEKYVDYTQSKTRAANGMLDTLIRGAGLYGAYIAAIKNVGLKAYELSQDQRKGRGKEYQLVLEALNVSPSIGIKARKLAKAWQSYSYNSEYFDYYGWNPIKNPHALEALTTLTSATLNVPLDRLMIKAENASAVLDSQYETWQRMAFFFGFSKWNLDLDEDQQEGTGTIDNPFGIDFDGNIKDLNLELKLDNFDIKF